MSALDQDRWSHSGGVASTEDLLRAAKHEGAALCCSLQNPVVRPWAREAIDAWERRVDRLIEREVPLDVAWLRGGPILRSSANGYGGYAPGAEAWWLERRIKSRTATLDLMISMLADRSAAKGHLAVGGAQPEAAATCEAKPAIPFRENHRG